MKQLLQNMRDGKTTVETVPAPQPKPLTALVQTAVSLVSAGTERMLVDFAEKNLIGKAQSRPDLVMQVLDKARREGIIPTIEAAFNRLDQPMSLGYSSAGTIIALGEGLTGFQVGDRVACAGSGYAVHAEYAVIPQNLLAHVPDHVNFEEAAFATLGTIAMHGFRLAQPQIGERVAVIGLGLVGLLAVNIARAAGTQVYGIDLAQDRIDLGRKLGATCATPAESEAGALPFTNGQGFDIVLICADTKSNDPIELAGRLARDRARVVAVGAVGLNIPRTLYYNKELNFIVSRSYGPGRYDDKYEARGIDYPIGQVRWTEGRNLQAFIDLLANRQINISPLISHRFTIDQAPQAYDLITGKTKQPFLGVVLTYPQQPASIPASHVEVIPAAQPGSAITGALRLGVMGAGNYAKAVFLPNVKKVGGVDRQTIVSSTGVSASHAAKKFAFQFASSSESDILDNPDINLVAILTRHNQHASQVITALQNGKHVFCEKPLAINLDELHQVAEVVMTSTFRLMVGFNRRFAPMSQQLHQFLQPRTEPLYAHYRVNAGYLPLNHWLHDRAQGGGRIIGEGCHFVDFLTFLVGSSPISVSAQSLPDQGKYRQDNVEIQLRFADGSLGIVTYLANGDKSISKERVEVFCAGKVALLDDFRNLTLTKDGKNKKINSPWKQEKGHFNAWQSFLESINTNASSPIPFQEIWGVTAATFAVVEALRSGNKEIVAPFPL